MSMESSRRYERYAIRVALVGIIIALAIGAWWIAKGRHAANEAYEPTPERYEAAATVVAVLESIKGDILAARALRAVVLDPQYAADEAERAETLRNLDRLLREMITTYNDAAREYNEAIAPYRGAFADPAKVPAGKPLLPAEIPPIAADP